MFVNEQSVCVVGQLKSTSI